MKLTFEQIERIWEEMDNGDVVEIIDTSNGTIEAIFNEDEETKITIGE